MRRWPTGAAGIAAARPGVGRSREPMRHDTHVIRVEHCHPDAQPRRTAPAEPAGADAADGGAGRLRDCRRRRWLHRWDGRDDRGDGAGGAVSPGCRLAQQPSGAAAARNLGARVGVRRDPPVPRRRHGGDPGPGCRPHRRPSATVPGRSSSAASGRLPAPAAGLLSDDARRWWADRAAARSRPDHRFTFLDVCTGKPVDARGAVRPGRRLRCADRSRHVRRRLRNRHPPRQGRRAFRVCDRCGQRASRSSDPRSVRWAAPSRRDGDRPC